MFLDYSNKYLFCSSAGLWCWFS